MHFVRLFTIVLILLSTALSGAMAASHAGPTDGRVETAAVVPADHQTCCADSMEQFQTCNALTAIIPATMAHGTAPKHVQSVTFGPSILLPGFEPAGNLDPPRPV